MTAMFSGFWRLPRSGCKNSLQDPATVYCDELWYSTNRCTPRFDPAAANAVLSELINVVNRGEVTYDCRYLDQVQLAIRYMIQRGLPRAIYATGGPNAYTGVLDPPCTRYNNFESLTIVFSTTNIGPVTLDAGCGAAYILRSDGNHLERQDLQAGIPYPISFINGYWYMLSLANSQVPLLVKGGIDCWIRTDGNDTLGDGTSNDPQHAFKTIAGCWAARSVSRYARRRWLLDQHGDSNDPRHLRRDDYRSVRWQRFVNGRPEQSGCVPDCQLLCPSIDVPFAVGSGHRRHEHQWCDISL